MIRPQPIIDPEREQAELEAYLGTAYDHGRLQQYQLQLQEEFEQAGDEARFYRNSEAYLYNLTAFAMTLTKAPYLGELTRWVPAGARVLDYGCGIGSDGLFLLEAGYRVEFADFDNPSTRYLRWRLRRRGIEAPVYDLDGNVPAGFDAAYAFDVIEHVPDPFGLLAEMESRARIVIVNLLEARPDEPLHRALPIAALLRHAARRRLLSYRVHHGRSHLAVYTTDRAGVTARLAGWSRLALGWARHNTMRR